MVFRDFLKILTLGKLWKSQLAFEVSETSSAKNWSSPTFSPYSAARSCLCATLPLCRCKHWSKSHLGTKSIFAFSCAESTCTHALIQFSHSCTDISTSTKGGRVEAIIQICCFQQLYQLKNDSWNGLHFQIERSLRTLPHFTLKANTIWETISSLPPQFYWGMSPEQGLTFGDPRWFQVLW